MDHSAPIDKAPMPDTGAPTPGGRRLAFRLLRSTAVERWLADPANRATWARLYRDCPWHLPTLSLEFFEIWTRHYAPPWEPVIVLATDPSGSVRGLVPLAATADLVTGVGGHQAEYQGWLGAAEDVLPLWQGLVELLRGEFPGRALRFKYLPDRMPLAALQALAGRDARIECRLHQTPLLKIDAAAIRKSLDKKSNKSKIARLKRGGELAFERIAANSLLPADLERIAALYDLRQGAVNDSCPFVDDPRKLAFHREWLERAPDHVDVLLWRLNGTIIAALLGLRSPQASHVAILAYAPEHAHDSPGKFHVYQSALALGDDGRAWLDLTPGGDPWKERFATDHAPALEILSLPGRAAAARARARSWILQRIRRGLSLIGVSPQSLRATLGRLRRISIAAIARRLRAAIHEHVEMRIYRLELARVVPAAIPAGAAINRLADLVRFTPIASWQTRHGFLASALARLEAGERSFSVCDADGLVHCGWLIGEQAAASISEVGERYEYPQPGAVLYDFFTAPRARGQGHYQRTIRQMLGALKSEGTAEVVYISTRADNLPSRHVIEKEGFEWICSLHRRRSLGRERRWRESKGS